MIVSTDFFFYVFRRTYLLFMPKSASKPRVPSRLQYWPGKSKTGKDVWNISRQHVTADLKCQISVRRGELRLVKSHPTSQYTDILFHYLKRNLFPTQSLCLFHKQLVYRFTINVGLAGFFWFVIFVYVCVTISMLHLMAKLN